MSDGERPSQNTGNGGGASGGALYDATCPISESTSSTSSGGNGYLASTSSSSAISPCSTSQSNAGALPTSSLSTASGTTFTAVVKAIDEPYSVSAEVIEGFAKNEDKTSTMNSDSSTDTFHTPSASLQNLSGSSFGSSRLNGSGGRKLSEIQTESQQRQQRQRKDRFLEEEEIVTSDSGAASAPTSVTGVEEINENSIPEGGGDECPSTSSDIVADFQSTDNSSELPAPKPAKNLKINLQQHKRQSSTGSQCSLSSNPENSQFKTADAHSSDSDSSRISGSNSGLIFDNFSVNDAEEIGKDEITAKDDQDRRSLQSDHSYSGEHLNTSVESVDFGSQGETSPITYRDVLGHSPRLSTITLGSGNGSASPPLQLSSQIHSVGSKPRGKKKMWYQQIFSTSYKTRSGDFKKIFKDLPPKERLIVDYSCALQKEILLQGRMYVSQNFVSFYANIFGWETQLSINFKEIESITKEKTALIIPNAIQISTMSEKFFFSSFVTRDTTYMMLFKLWQSALLEDVSDTKQNMSKKELWKLVHTCYGEELGVTSEDESEEMFCQPIAATTSVSAMLANTVSDGVKSISIDSEEGCPTPRRGTPEITVDMCDDDHEHDGEDDGDDEEPRIGSLEWCRLRTGSALSGLINTGDIGPAIAVGLNIGSSIVTSNGIPIPSEQLLLKDAMGPLVVPVLPMTVDPSDSSDAEALLEADLIKDIPSVVPVVIPLSSEPLESVDSGVILTAPVCPVDHEDGKKVMNAVIPCNIDQLFTMLFTNSAFYLDFQVKRKTTDLNLSDWQLGEGSQKTRQLTFTVLTGQTIGPKQAQVTETQTLIPASQPGLFYAIQSESVNAGIPYADCFSVNCHYCLTKLSDNESNMVVVGKIKYKKSTWAKTFIEKNSINALTDFFHAMEKALKEECVKMSAGGVTPTSPIVVSNLPRRRHPRKKGRAPDIPASAMTRPIIESNMVHAAVGRGGSLSAAASEAMGEAVMDSMESSLVMKVILAILGCLLLLNAFLYFKLSSLETAANVSVLYPPRIHFSGEAPQTHQEWLMLLQQQETMHRTEVHSWHEVLISAIKILHQAEKDLESLKSHITQYGTENIAIVAKPTSSNTGGIVNVLGTTQSISDVSSEKGVPPVQDVDKNNNSDSIENGSGNKGDSEVKV